MEAAAVAAMVMPRPALHLRLPHRMHPSPPRHRPHRQWRRHRGAVPHPRQHLRVGERGHRAVTAPPVLQGGRTSVRGAECTRRFVVAEVGRLHVRVCTHTYRRNGCGTQAGCACVPYCRNHGHTRVTSTRQRMACATLEVSTNQNVSLHAHTPQLPLAHIRCMYHHGQGASVGMRKLQVRKPLHGVNHHMHSYMHADCRTAAS